MLPTSQGLSCTVGIFRIGSSGGLEIYLPVQKEKCITKLAEFLPPNLTLEKSIQHTVMRYEQTFISPPHLNQIVGLTFQTPRKELVK